MKECCNHWKSKQKKDMMYNSEQLLSLVNGHLAQMRYDRQPTSLYDPIKYVLSIGGKRLRPVLALMSYNLYRENPEKILTQACALETYHNFTLLHDDLMDNADMRRGCATVHCRWNANAAILSGDTMLILAFQQMQQCDTHHLQPVVELFIETMLEIGEGQQMDMEFETRNDVTVDEYIEMIRLKTSVLLACALKTGALLGDAPAEDVENLYILGERLGLAFQLQDDLLDVYGDPDVFGKAIGGDIMSNKKTFMLISAMSRANDKQREELEKWISAKDFDREEKVCAVTKLYDQIGIHQLCEEKIKYYYDQSRQSLDLIQLPANRKQMLSNYMDELMSREY
jgi:geranylgeranyl diphosphate synthase type II